MTYCRVLVNVTAREKGVYANLETEFSWMARCPSPPMPCTRQRSPAFHGAVGMASNTVVPAHNKGASSAYDCFAKPLPGCTRSLLSIFRLASRALHHWRTLTCVGRIHVLRMSTIVREASHLCIFASPGVPRSTRLAPPTVTPVPTNAYQDAKLESALLVRDGDISAVACDAPNSLMAGDARKLESGPCPCFCVVADPGCMDAYEDLKRLRCAELFGDDLPGAVGDGYACWATESFVNTGNDDVHSYEAAHQPCTCSGALPCRSVVRYGLR